MRLEGKEPFLQQRACLPRPMTKEWGEGKGRGAPIYVFMAVLLLRYLKFEDRDLRPAAESDAQIKIADPRIDIEPAGRSLKHAKVIAPDPVRDHQGAHERQSD